MSSEKYYALYKELKSKILAGEWKPGDKLPSKRITADKTRYSLITVERAYAMLEDEGYITAQERKGYFVCEIDAAFSDLRSPAVKKLDLLPEPTAHARQDFEYSVWFRTVRKVIAEKGELLFVKSPGKGCSVLRNAISGYLQRYRGMYAPPARIIIGSGAEQLYETAVRILGREHVFGIENPSYGQIKSVYSGMGVKICPLSMGGDGIESAALSGCKFDVLHVTPFHSYPSGINTSIAKKYEYLRWAKRTANYIIEDDFDSEFFVPGHPVETLFSLDASQSVIYINTFSKSLSPSVRIGYMILPERLMEKYDRILGSFSCSVPVMEQYVLAEFISGGNFERHLNHVRRTLKDKK